MKASIIVPTFNRKDQLLLSLLSFNHQVCAQNSFEVIVVDDSSTDGTDELIGELKVNYKLRLIRNEQNRGAAAARNIGLNAAENDIIIFSDSDCIVPSNFIEGHLKYHESDFNIAVCAVISWKKVFSVYYDHFNRQQKNEFEAICAKKPEFKSRLLNIELNREGIGRILFEQDLREIDQFSYLPEWSDYFLGDVIKTFGLALDGFEYPWVLFGTGNLSIRKQHLMQAGGFDEALSREEDWDLGYRLYKAGIKFICAKELESIHQEHLISMNLNKQTIDCYKVIFDKYYDIDMKLFCLFNEGVISLLNLSRCITEYRTYLQYNSKYSLVIDKFHQLIDYRTNAYLQMKTATGKFMNVNHELKKIYPIRNRINNFMVVYKELARIYE